MLPDDLIACIARLTTVWLSPVSWAICRVEYSELPTLGPAVTRTLATISVAVSWIRGRPRRGAAALLVAAEPRAARGVGLARCMRPVSRLFDSF